MARAEIKGRMSMDAKGVRVGVEGAKKSVSGFSKSLGSLKGIMAGAFTVGAVTAFAKSVADLGGEISDFSFQTAMSTDAFQAFNSVAMDGGASMAMVQKGLTSLRDAQSAALNGEQMYADAFADLGITLEEVANSSMEQLLQRTAEAAKETGNFSALVDILGKRSAAKLEEALYVLADQGFPALIASTKEAGDVIDEEMIAKLDKASDRMEKFNYKAKSVAAILWGKNLKFGDAQVETYKNLFSKDNPGGGNSYKRIFYALVGAVKTVEKADQEAIDKAAKKREKNLEREQKQRTGMIEKLYEKEEQLAVSKGLKLSAFKATSSITRIGGKIGGQDINLATRLQEVKNHLAQIEQNTGTMADGSEKSVKLVGG